MAADETLELVVSINGYPTGKVGEFIKRGDSLFVTPAEMEELGLRVPPEIRPGPDGLLPLSSLSGVTSRLDWSSQSLDFQAESGRLLPSVLHPRGSRTESYDVESGLGATLNYDLVGSHDGDGTAVSGMFDARGFSPWGVVSTGVLVFAGHQPTSGSSAVRLDSSYTYSDPETMRRYRLGDFIDGGLGWTRPVRLGGVQIQSDFSMRPDLVTFPLPTVQGQAAVPSTVDVIVNSTQLLSQQVPPGPFEIPQLPVVNGANTITTTVTNALGQQITTTMPFYASGGLLAPGLQSYSAEAGFVRRNWGLVSNDYGVFAASGTYVRGLSPVVTAEAHAEGAAGNYMAGAGLIANVFNLGVANLDVAGSTGNGHSGHQISMGAQRLGQIVSFGVSATFADRNFRDIAAISGDPAPLRQLSANAGLSLGKFGSLSLAYTSVDRDTNLSLLERALAHLKGPVSATSSGGDAGEVPVVQPAEHAHIVSASYSVQMGQLSFYATGYNDFVRHGGGNGVMIGITLPLGARSSLDTSAGTGSGGAFAQVQAVQSVVTPGDWGYQVYANTGNGNRAFAEAEYKSSWALLSAGVDRSVDGTAVRAEAQGAVSVTDGAIFASNTIDDSFAVVDTDGAAGIRVMNENRLAGITDAEGKLLVPDLRAFDLNHLSIDPADVPVTDTLAYVARDVRPQDRSGVVVRFPVHRSNAALVHLLDSLGHPLPVGSVATLAATGASVPVGYDGAAYVENLQPDGNVLNVIATDSRRCIARFDYRAEPGAIPEIGPVRCEAPP